MHVQERGKREAAGEEEEEEETVGVFGKQRESCRERLLERRGRGEGEVEREGNARRGTEGENGTPSHGPSRKPAESRLKEIAGVSMSQSSRWADHKGRARRTWR